MKHRKILFVVNPISGDKDKSSFLDLLKQKSALPGFTISVYKTTGTGDAEKIKSEMKTFQPDTVVAAGGDGTVRLVAVLLVNTHMSLGILPLGSANGMARDLDLPTVTEQALELIFEGKTKAIDIIKMTNDKYCFHLSDLGVNSRIVKSFDEDKTRGFWGYLRSLVKETKDIKTFRCSVTIEKTTVMLKAIMVILANGSFYGTNANINPTGSLNDGKFEVILIKPPSVLRMIKLTLASFIGTFHKQHSIRVFSCKEATVKVSPEQYLQIDGEVEAKTDTLTAEIIPGAINIISRPD